MKKLKSRHCSEEHHKKNYHQKRYKSILCQEDSYLLELVRYAGHWESIAKLPKVELIDPYEPGIPPEEGLSRRRQGMVADFMIASANAITLDGRFVNLDGMGNRVSAMSRVKHYAAPVKV